MCAPSPEPSRIELAPKRASAKRAKVAAPEIPPALGPAPAPRKKPRPNFVLRIGQGPRNPTGRERSILTLLAAGNDQSTIAGIHGVRPGTIRNQLTRMRDMWAPTTPSLIALAIKLGWITVPILVEEPETSTRAACSQGVQRRLDTARKK